MNAVKQGVTREMMRFGNASSRIVASRFYALASQGSSGLHIRRMTEEQRRTTARMLEVDD